MFSLSSQPSRGWSDRRILTLVALGALLVTAIWHIPEEAAYISARVGELLFALTLALAMTYVMRPIVLFFTRWTGNSHKGRSWATFLAFMVLALALYLMFLVGYKPVEKDIRELIQGFWPQTNAGRTALIESWRLDLIGKLEPYRFALPAALFDDPNYFQNQIRPLFNNLGDWLKHQTSHIGFIVELLLVPVLAFYFLADGPAIRREVALLCPARFRAMVGRMGGHFDHVLDGFVRGQIWMCVIAWVLVTVALWALGVPHAVTLGLVAGLTRAIPVVGPLLGAIPLLVVCQFYTDTQTTVLLLFGFTLMHFLESKVLLPKIVGHHVDLHPVSVILSLLIGMEFFGVIGVFLAVPIAAVLKIVLVEYHRNQEQKLAVEQGRALPLLPPNGNGVRAETEAQTSN